MKLYAFSVLAGFFVFILTGCAPATAPTATPGSSPESAPLPTASPEAKKFFAIINEYRGLHGLGALTLDPLLMQVGEWMASDMAENNRFAHEDSLGRDPFKRMSDLGYAFNTWRGENLAAGVATAEEAFKLWKNSPGHNANMMNPNFTVIGIARTYTPASHYGWYWATEFGGYASAPSSRNNTGEN